ncbi:MAG: prenyltransferase/squalene oxidase repeat-containing protein [Promethearchaeota archaeon]
MHIIPDFFIPHYETVLNFFKGVSEQLLKYPNLDLEVIYWYLMMVRYLQVDLNKMPTMTKELFKFVKKCEIKKDDDVVGFKLSPRSKQTEPDIWSTAYALIILKSMGKLSQYLTDPSIGVSHNQIKMFVESCRNKREYVHCLSNCEICKKTTVYRTVFSVLEIFLSLYGDNMPRMDKRDIIEMIKKSPGNSAKNVFRLIDLRLVNYAEIVNPDELEHFANMQKKDGGFSFNNNQPSNLNATFWVGYLLESYRSMVDYSRGKLYAYIVQKIKGIDIINDVRDASKLIQVSKLIILLNFVWRNLVNELEDVVFSSLSKKPMMSINELIMKSGVRNAEYEVVAFINFKYNIVLDIRDNEERFKQFLLKLDTIEKQFAKIIYAKAKNYVQIDLKEILDSYNRNLEKNVRISIDFIVKIVEKMLKEFFIIGNIIERKKLFKKYYYLVRDEFVKRIIISNKPVVYEDIQKEKKRLNELREDIFNMTREIKQSAKNIINEVESLIFIGETEYAEKRLTNNIRKALLDAEFFNKDIELSLESFEYIKPERPLKDVLDEWRRVYSNLQSDFRNVKLIMMEKIQENMKLLNLKNLLTDLEAKINKYITDFRQELDLFKEEIRDKIDIEQSDHARENIEELQEKVFQLDNRLKALDTDIYNLSHRILSEDEKIRKMHKKVINKWQSAKEDFDKAINYYIEGFGIWKQNIDKINELYDHYMERVKHLENDINNLVQDRKFNEAYKIIEEAITQIHQDLLKNDSEFGRITKELSKNRRNLYLLFKNIEKEWAIQRRKLAELVDNMREDLKDKVSVDKKRIIREGFNQLINEKIDYLEDAILNMELQLKKAIKAENRTNLLNIIDSHFSNLEVYYISSNKDIQQYIQKNEKDYQTIRVENDTYIKRWERFQAQFSLRIKQLRKDLIEELILRYINDYSNKVNKNQIDLAEIAKQIGLEKKDVLKHVNDMLSKSKLSGDYIKGTDYIILHNKEWRLNKRIKLFIDGQLNELKSIENRIAQLYNTSIKERSFNINIEEIREVSESFLDKKEEIIKEFNQKIDELKPNRENEMFIENLNYFQENINKLSSNVNSILDKANKSIEFTNYMNEQLNKIKTMINIKIHNIEDALAQRKLIPYSKNKSWLKHTIDSLESEIKTIKSNVYKELGNKWANIQDSDDIRNEFNRFFENKFNKIYDSFKDSIDEFNQTIINYEYTRIKAEMDKILAQKQNQLNKYLGKIQNDVLNKVEYRDYPSAMQTLHAKIEQINNLIKETEKELKNKNKKLAKKSEIFPLNSNRYLLRRWKNFKEEYINVVNEKESVLEKEIIETYINKTINAFKGKFVPFSFLADYFKIKKSKIQDIIIKLISEKRIAGNIYVHYDLYYEDESEIDKLDKDTLESMRSGVYKDPLKSEKLKRFAKQYSPIITTLASLVTIIFYIIRLFSELYIPAWVLILLLGLLIILVVQYAKFRDYS